jgi:hypothetical protein
MIHNLRLANLTDIREYLDVPIHLNEAGLILRDYLEMSYPDRHWNDIQEMVEALEDDGVAYMEQHGGQKMNPKYTAMQLEIDRSEKARKRKEYDERVRIWRKSHPKIVPKTIELRSMIDPEDWEAYQAEEEDQRERGVDPSATQKLLEMVATLQRDAAQERTQRQQAEEVRRREAAEERRAMLAKIAELEAQLKKQPE